MKSALDPNAPGGRLRAACALRGGLGALAAALLYAVLLAAVFPEAVFEGRVFTTPDSVAPRGFGDYLAQQGLSAHWNPFLFGGMPAYASLGHDPDLYLPGPVLRGLTRLFALPPLSWLLAHYLWLGLGLFLFLRRRGLRPWLAWLAGAWFLLLPPQIAIGAHGHGSKVMTLAWLPWVLLAADALLDALRLGSRLRAAAGLAAALAGLLLAAHIQIAYYALLTLALFAACRLVLILRRGGWRAALAPAALGLAALAIAAAASAPLYGPVWEYSGRSIRGAAAGGGTGFDYATGWSLAPSEWTSFLWPASWGYGAESYFGFMPMTDYANYLGWLPLLAAAVLFWGRRPRRFDLFFLVLALATTLVAAGRFLPFVYKPLYALLPGFNRFRVPVMILVLQQLALAILMARGLERAWREPASLARLRWLTAGAALLLLLAAGLGPGLQAGRTRAGLQARYGAQLARIEPARAAAFLDEQAALAGRWLREDALRAGLLLLPLAGVIEWRRRRFAPAPAPARGQELALAGALALALLADLGPLAGRILHPERHWPTREGTSLWGEPRPTASRLPARTLDFLSRNLEGQRFYALPGSAFAANEAAAAGLASLGGYHAAKPAFADSLLKALPTGGAEILNRMAVRFLVSPRALGLGPGFSPAGPAGSTEEAVYRNENALPRLRLAERVRVEPAAASRQRLFTGQAEPGLVYLEREPALAFAPAATPPGELLAPQWGLDEVACQVRLARPALLVLADLAYPGWRVEVDGVERPLLLADGLLRAVALEAGEHTVRFRFLPPRLALYGALRWTAWAALLALAGAGFAPRRRRQEAVA
ncbi:YfhO family protein [bacterium]|nr:YfhO family protein [bacterium]